MTASILIIVSSMLVQTGQSYRKTTGIPRQNPGDFHKKFDRHWLFLIASQATPERPVSREIRAGRERLRGIPQPD